MHDAVDGGDKFRGHWIVRLGFHGHRECFDHFGQPCDNLVAPDSILVSRQGTRPRVSQGEKEAQGHVHRHYLKGGAAALKLPTQSYEIWKL